MQQSKDVAQQNQKVVEKQRKQECLPKSQKKCSQLIARKSYNDNDNLSKIRLAYIDRQQVITCSQIHCDKYHVLQNTQTSVVTPCEKVSFSNDCSLTNFDNSFEFYNVLDKSASIIECKLQNSDTVIFPPYPLQIFSQQDFDISIQEYLSVQGIPAPEKNVIFPAIPIEVKLMAPTDFYLPKDEYCALINRKHMANENQNAESCDSRVDLDRALDDTFLSKHIFLSSSLTSNFGSTITLSESYGAILLAYCEKNCVLIVQEKQVSFWVLDIQSQWVGVKPLVRNVTPKGQFMSHKVTHTHIDDDLCLVYLELWASHLAQTEHTVLSLTTYKYTVGKKKPVNTTLEVGRVEGRIKTASFCLLKDLTIIVCCSTSMNLSHIWKCLPTKNVDVAQKSVDLESVGTAVDTVCTIEGCQWVVLGSNKSRIFLWEHTTGRLLKTLHFQNHSSSQTELCWNQLWLAEQDQGFIFLLCETSNTLNLLVVHLKTEKWKLIHQYQIDRPNFVLRMVHITNGRLVAGFHNGFKCWDLTTGSILTEIDAIQYDQTFLTREHGILTAANFTVKIVNMDQVFKI